MKYDGTDLSTFSTFHSGASLFNTPEKDVEYFSVPGRNGDLIIDNNRFNNIEITIPCFIRNNFTQNYSDLMNFLLSKSGYKKLETEEESDIFRMASFTNAVSPETGTFLKYGNFDLVFNCKPQKFLKSGEDYVSMSSGGKLTNPTLFDSFPLLKITGTGNVSINGTTITVNRNTSTLYIDTEVKDAYEGYVNRNGDITLPGDFPTLKPGENTVTFTVSSLEIMPRWWKL